MHKGYWTKSTGKVFNSRVACVSTSHSYDYALDTSHTDTEAYTQTSTQTHYQAHTLLVNTIHEHKNTPNAEIY